MHLSNSYLFVFVVLHGEITFEKYVFLWFQLKQRDFIIIILFIHSNAIISKMTVASETYV